MKKTIFVIGMILLLACGQALAAGPNTANITSISTTNPSSTQSGSGKNYNLSANVEAGQLIGLTFTVGASGSGNTSTVYPDTLYLTASTLVGPEDVSFSGLSDCTLNSRLATCNESATITAPSTPGAYQVKILADDGRGGNEGKMNSDHFMLNFTVVVPQCTPAATTLVLSTPDCVILHATSVSLSATLKSGTTPLVGESITFYVEGEDVGTADTDGNGVATLNFDPSNLPVGDYSLSAAWDSDDPCLLDPTVTGADLGVQYLFLGFQPPIKADGSTILTGKAGPVKIKIVDANGVPVSDATALVYFEQGTPAVVGTEPENASVGLNFDYGNLMRFSDDQYVYNWNLSTVANGTYTVRVFLWEGSCAPAHQVVVSVGKKSK